METAVAEKEIVIDEERRAVVGELMRDVYVWMTAGLAVTGTIAWIVANSPVLLNLIFGHMAVFLMLIGAELLLVFVLSSKIQKLSFVAAATLYTLYCVLNGVSFSSIFHLYELSSIGQIFLVTAGSFGVLAFVGTVTKKDLSRLGTFLYMALGGMVIASVIGLVAGWEEPMLMSIAGVLIFAGLTVYDAQKIRQLLLNEETVNEGNMKLALLGALSLYLDFINLMLKLLRLFGKVKKR